MKSHRRCEICKKKFIRENNRKRDFLAKFPLDEDRCRQWVKIVGNEDLLHLPIEKLHELKHVCGEHFEKNNFNKKRTRLKNWAVPTLLLKAPPLPDYLLSEFPLHMPKVGKNIPTKLGISENDQAVNKRLLIDITNKSEQYKSALPSATGTTEAAVAVQALEHDHNYYAQPKDRIPSTNQDIRVSPSTNVTTEAAVSVQALNHDHNYYTKPENRIPSHHLNQEMLAASKPAYGTIEAALAVQALEHDHTYYKQPKDRIPGPTPDIRAPASTSGTKINHDHDRNPSNLTNEKIRDVTPREKKLLHKLQTCKIKLKTLQKKMHVIESIESPVLKTLITSTVKNQNRKPQAKRWSNADKGLALSIYKKSPKAYRFLRHIVPLPSIRTLQIVLQNMTLEPGLNDDLLSHLQKKANGLTDEDKICVIMFDEMALKKRLLLNTCTDKIEGFEDFGEAGRTSRFADHALVFMMQGVVTKYKQPLAHYFVKGTVSTEKLTVLLKNVIRKVTAQGFTVIATVCDQGSTNIGALNLLKRLSGNNMESNYFILDDRKIYIIYDIPHLFKSIRNNFLQAGEIEWGNKIAKWCHLVQLEEVNRERLHFKKITKTAVQPKYKGKMKVKLASQILSNTVSAVMKLWADSQPPERKRNLLETAEVVGDLDHLFDLTNGPASPKDRKTNLRENVTQNSFHHGEWSIYKQKLQTLRFIKNGNQLRNVKCVKGYLISITSLQDISTYFQECGWTYMNLRQFNQDSLENLFGMIRQHSPTNRNPTCYHFTAAMKSSILSRLSTPVSRGANCEQDKNSLIFDFHDLVFNKDAHDDNVTTSDHPTFDEEYSQSASVSNYLDTDMPPELSIPDNDEEDIEEDLAVFKNQPTVYVSGFIAKKMLTDNTCETCCQALRAQDTSSDVYKFINLKEWDDNPRLTYPSIDLCNEIKSLTKVFEENIKNILHIANVTEYSQTVLLGHLNMAWLCKEHVGASSMKLVRMISLLLIRNECRLMNETLSLSEDSSDDILKKAQQACSAK